MTPSLLYTVAAPSGNPTAAELATPDPAPDVAEAALAAYTLPFNSRPPERDVSWPVEIDLRVTTR
jgi:hypothetical protein